MEQNPEQVILPTAAAGHTLHRGHQLGKRAAGLPSGLSTSPWARRVAEQPPAIAEREVIGSSTSPSLQLFFKCYTDFFFLFSCSPLFFSEVKASLAIPVSAGTAFSLTSNPATPQPE